MNKYKTGIENKIKKTRVGAGELTKLGSNASGTVEKAQKKAAKKIKKILKS